MFKLIIVKTKACLFAQTSFNLTLYIHFCFYFLFWDLKHTENVRLLFLPDLKLTGPGWLVLPMTVGESVMNHLAIRLKAPVPVSAPMMQVILGHW